MSFLDQLRKRRQKLADVMADEEYSGIRKLVERLYPDQAHFLYELLQNAEDAGAHEVHFELSTDKLVFLHDGRPFSEKDVEGITNIGKGTKEDDEEKIGRFGVGFKAVFGYSDTPHIYSPTFSFKLCDLVLPYELTVLSDLGRDTRFEFPFDNSKKPADVAFQEVAAGLDQLARTTLLFLANIERVTWKVANGDVGEVLRAAHSPHHYEILKETREGATFSSHFLKFEENVEGLERQRVAAAFELEFLPDVENFDSNIPLHKQMKIIAAKSGRVAVFFPAEKEKSGLRFHLHAPFITGVDRASVKESEANAPLFRQLATLTAASLCQIRDLKLLTADFLAVLPNPYDDLSEPYTGIRESIVDAMNTHPLTPTYRGHHAAAENLLQAKAVLKDLLTKDDLALLHEEGGATLQWAASANQRNGDIERFLQSLDIGDWDVSRFADTLLENLETYPPRRRYSFHDPAIVEWFTEKPAEWHQRLYAMFFAELHSPSKDRLKKLKFVRLRGGSLSLASECFFLDGIEESDDFLQPVDEAVYSSRRSKSQRRENAHKFLVELGVREIGEAERVEAILRRRYTQGMANPPIKVHHKDLKQFMTLVKQFPETADMFGYYCIFQNENGDWCLPEQIYLDTPYMDTGLSSYFSALDGEVSCATLARSYLNCGSDKRSVATFAEAVGAATYLEVIETSCRENPAYDQLVRAAQGNWSKEYGVDVDFEIQHLDDLLVHPNQELSRFIWATICKQKSPAWYIAKYRNNSNHPIIEKPSQLACLLRDTIWLPQTDGRFVRPAQASQELLPPGFPFDAGWPWLKALNFGVEAARKSEEYRRKQTVAQELGFPDSETLERAQRLSSLPREFQDRMFAEYERGSAELPHNEPSNSERRAKQVGDEATDAPERRTEERVRSVSVDRDFVKEEAGQYLRQQYKNPDGDVICQICKAPLPFKLDNGAEYFERVQFLPSLVRHYFQNYLCLCPLHAAMFKYANGSEDLLPEMFAEISGSELELVLARNDATIFFTKTHIADLQVVIKADMQSPPKTSSNSKAEQTKWGTR